MKYRYHYENNEECLKQLETIKEKYKEKDYLKEIIIMGNNVDVIFKEESYKNKSYEERQKEYLEGGKIHV